MEHQLVAIVIFDGVEVLDFCGPFEVFSVTRLDEARRAEDHSPFDVRLVAERADPVTTTGGMRVVPHHTFGDCPPTDILLVPGGWGTREQSKNPLLLDWLRRRAAATGLLASVCTGSMVLGSAGLLDGRRATTHWRWLDRMRDSFPAVRVEFHRHFVEDGHLWTSAGISAGIDMALRIVQHLYGDPVARAAARQMEYPYPDSDERRIAIA